LNATKEVADLTKFGPINRQSDGVMRLLHGARTQVHLVTLLEEMPVQETIDAAEDLTAAGFRIGAVIVNRVRPALVSADQVGVDGGVDATLLAAGLRAVDLPVGLAGALAVEMDEYAARIRVQVENEARLEAVHAPHIELPDLNPPVELGELAELAARFEVAPG
jgi:anion-transporting  ArsA/GET3 family ATPase